MIDTEIVAMSQQRFANRSTTCFHQKLDTKSDYAYLESGINRRVLREFYLFWEKVNHVRETVRDKDDEKKAARSGGTTKDNGAKVENNVFMISLFLIVQYPSWVS